MSLVREAGNQQTCRARAKRRGRARPPGALLLTILLLASGDALTQPAPPNLESLRTTADDAFREKRYADALRVYQQLEPLLPPAQVAEVLHATGLCHQALGQRAEALKAFAGAVARWQAQKGRDSSTKAAVALLAKQPDWTKAFAELQQAALGLEAPEATVAHLAVRLAFDGYHWSRRFADEIALCQKILATYPDERRSCATAAVSLGSALIRQGKYEEGYSALRKAALDYGDFPEVAATARQRIVYSAMRHEQNHARALAEASGFMKEYADKPWAVQWVAEEAAVSAKALGDDARACTALEELARSVTHAAALARLCCTLGELYGRNADTERSVLWYEKVLALDCERSLKEEAQSRLDDCAARTADLTNLTGVLALGRKLLQHGSLSAVDALLKRLEGVAERAAVPGLLAGELAVARGDLSSARRHFEEALRASPADPDARFQLATVVDRLEGAGAAAACWSAFLAVESDSARAAAVRRGWVALSPPRLLRQGDSAFASPTYSPDGKLVAAAKERAGKWDLVVLDRATRSTRVVAECRAPKVSGYYLPRWFPDGRRLLFSAEYEWPQTEVLTVSTEEGATPRPLLPTVGRSYDARLGPQADRLLFAGPDQGVWTATVDGGDTQPLVARLPWGKLQGLSSPQWSADGRWLFCSVSTDRWKTFDLYRVDPRQPQERQLLAKGEAQARYPQLSPDGTALVFARGDGGQTRGGKRDLWLVDAQGAAEPYAIARGEFSWQAPCDWRPDGRGLIYADKQGRLWELSLGGLSGTGLDLSVALRQGRLCGSVRNRRSKPTTVALVCTRYDAQSHRIDNALRVTELAVAPGATESFDEELPPLPEGGTLSVTARTPDGCGPICLLPGSRPATSPKP